MTCRVSLLAYTPDADSVVAAAARLCYSNDPVAVLKDGLSPDRVRSFVSGLLRSGHHSPLEHASFTFAVDGISRVTTHQIVRHRIASYSQRSQRYVRMCDAACIVPPSVMKDVSARKIFDDAVKACHEAYSALVDAGIPKEDARYVLPHGWETSIVITMNARELHHFFALRLCRRAQWEIREVARGMAVEVRKVAPVMFGIVGPGCVHGECPEKNPCGSPFDSVDDVLKGAESS
jgi:thymidylate synthase (FAD)